VRSKSAERPTGGQDKAEQTDILVIGSGFGGAIAAYNSRRGAKVTVLERGPGCPATSSSTTSSSARLDPVIDFVAG